MKGKRGGGVFERFFINISVIFVFEKFTGEVGEDFSVDLDERGEF